MGQGARRLTVVVLGVLLALLAALVVLGMATGYELEFDKGTVPRGFVLFQLGLGVLVLALTAFRFVDLRALWRGRERAGRRVAGWMIVVLVAWSLWAFVRIGQYAS
jgi:hypothetical protein